MDKSQLKTMGASAMAGGTRIGNSITQFYTRYEAYIQITRLNKPIGIFLLLWPTYWALWLAGAGIPSFFHWVCFTAGVVLTRSAGCVINDYFDRNFDGRVRRTAQRPLVTGALKPSHAIYLFIILCLLALGVAIALALSTGSLMVIYFSVAAALLLSLYPLFKRFTHLPQVVLGMAFAMSVLMAYVVIRNKFPPIEAWVLYVGVVLWATFYDTMYALVDKDDDKKIGVKSTAILFGDMYRLILGIIFIIIMLSLLLVADIAQLTFPFYVGAGVASILAGYQFFLIHDRKPEWCFKAFLNNNWFGALVFLGIFYHYLYKEEGFSSLFIIISICIALTIVLYNFALARRADNMKYVKAIAILLAAVVVALAMFV